jgi:hypothetical protein
MTITDTHNDNINGLDRDVPGNPLFFTECIAIARGFVVRDPWTLS